MKKTFCILLSFLFIMNLGLVAFADNNDTNSKNDFYLDYENEYYNPDEDEYYNPDEDEYYNPDEDESIEPDVPITPDFPSENDEVIAILYHCAIPYPVLHYPFGHSWICVKNVSDHDLYIGSQIIAPGETISAGLHFFVGMTFNEEMNDLRGHSVTAKEYKLNEKDFAKMSKEILNSKWSWYEMFVHNCTNFSAAVWRATTGKNAIAICFPFIIYLQLIGSSKIKIQ